MFDSAIFGTPPEPIFNLTSSCLSSELLEELLYILAGRNESAAQSACSTDGAFKQGKIAEMIFLVCDTFKQPSEARYLALEIFDRFMTKYIQDGHTKIHSGTEPVHKKLKRWRTFRNKLTKHLKLYIVCCVQIASKLCSHYKILTCRKCSGFLLDAGLGCVSSTILMTELNILKTLEYKIPTLSPLTYVETLLEIMDPERVSLAVGTIMERLFVYFVYYGHNDSATNVKFIHATSLQVMDAAYLRRGKIHDALFKMMTSKTTATPGAREKFSIVEHDEMLFAAATIGAASYMIDKESSDMVTDHVSRITCIPVDYILEFAAILVENILP